MPNKLLCELVPSSFFSFFFFWRQRSSFYFLIFIYLGVPGLSCSMQDLFLVEVCWIFGCGIQILSCGLWDLVLWLGIEPGSHALGAKCLSHWTTREISLQSPNPTFDLISYCTWLLWVYFVLSGVFPSFSSSFLSSSLPPLNIKSISSWHPVLIFLLPCNKWAADYTLAHVVGCFLFFSICCGAPDVLGVCRGEQGTA